MGECKQPCEIYSRVTGFIRPVSGWNSGKKEEFKDRKKFKVPKTTFSNALENSGD